MPRVHRASRLCSIVVLILAVASFVRPIAAEAASFDSALLPAFSNEYEQRFGDSLTTYEIDVRFRPENNRLSGSMQVHFTNLTGESLKEIAFRLYPNATYYGSAYTSITDALVDGIVVDPAYQADKTVMILPLSAPLAPDEAVTISLTFRVVIPDDSNGTFGIFTHDTGRDLWTLADWYPIVAGWDADLGWRVDAPTPAGDPTYADAGIYSVTITYPSAMKMVATGTAIDSEPQGDLVTETIETGPVRDFTMIAGADLESVDSNVGGTDIHVWSTTTPAAQDAAAWVSDLASKMLAAYNGQFGQYPYDELDLVSTPIRQSVLGVSWSGLVMLSDKLFLNDLSWINQNPNTAAFAITHELGHQWWGNMIGANSNDHSFMVEGLTNALTIGAIDTVLGAETADALLSEQITGPYRNALESVGDGVVDTQVGKENPNGPSRVALTYGKGALGFLALRLAMGDAAFYDAIDEYAQDYLYLNATPDELRALFIKHAPEGVDVQTIWRTWFYRSATLPDDVDALADQIDDRFYAS
ncbi:hypothetical protein BH09CHL1_BH09CHL1_15980 [soil metagenome]